MTGVILTNRKKIVLGFSFHRRQATGTSGHQTDTHALLLPLDYHDHRSRLGNLLLLTFVLARGLRALFSACGVQSLIFTLSLQILK